MIESGSIVISTDRLILRKITLNDADLMYKNWASDNEVATMAGFPVHTSINDTIDIIKVWLDEYSKEHTYNWVIELKESGEIIGTISIVKKDLKNLVAEIGYSLGKKYWNNGYITEAVKAVIDYLFRNNIFETITANFYESNIGSGRVLEKNGFVFEGILRNRYIVNGEKTNLVSVSILKEEYMINNNI